MTLRKYLLNKFVFLQDWDVLQYLFWNTNKKIPKKRENEIQQEVKSKKIKLSNFFAPTFSLSIHLTQGVNPIQAYLVLKRVN